MIKISFNKKLIRLLSIFIFAFILLSLTGCDAGSDVKVLRVYNWQEYIDDGTDDDGNKVDNSVMEDFEEWYKDKYNEEIRVIYETFETNEVMLNTLKTGKTEYDLVCPSEYAIQKMIKNDMLEEWDFDLKDKNGDLILSNYGNISSYIINLFEEDSYHLDKSEFAIANTSYANVIYPSAINYKNIYATQFHPEKSGEIGLKILKNFGEL